MKIMGLSAYTNFPTWGFMNIQKWGFIRIHKFHEINPQKNSPIFGYIHRSPIVFPHENPVETLPVDTSIRPKTFSASRHSLAFSQALSTAPQVTSGDYASARAWCCFYHGKNGDLTIGNMEKGGFNHSKCGCYYDLSMKNLELTIETLGYLSYLTIRRYGFNNQRVV